MLNENQSAPPFSLPDQSGQTHSLKDYQGKWLLLYFYPKDNTPGCTTEACEIRDNFNGFQEANIQVLGISRDSVQSHEKFAAKHDLPFPLLADTDEAVSKLYKALGEKSMFGKTFLGLKRVSYLIDPNGQIAKVYPKVKPKQHAREVLEDVKTLS